MTLKILIADDHEIMREGLSSLIAKQTDMKVVGEAANGDQAIQLARELVPDIVIMDITMPGTDGIVATRKILKANSKIKIVVLSMYSNKHFLIKVLRAGAKAYLTKEKAFKELIEAIYAVREDRTYLCDKMVQVVVDDFKDRVVKTKYTSAPVLNEKECEILRLLAEGLSTKEIGRQMRKSSKTIDAYRREIMNKLGTNSLAELVKFALREGVITLKE